MLNYVLYDVLAYSFMTHARDMYCCIITSLELFSLSFNECIVNFVKMMLQ